VTCRIALARGTGGRGNPAEFVECQVVEYRELLAADIAVELELLTPEEAAQGRGGLTEAERAQIDKEVERLLAESKGDARLALARRGVGRKLHQSLAPKTSHALSDAGAHVRAPLRTLTEERYIGFLPLGEGGMGLVYLALDTELNRKVAFKMVRSGADQPLDATPQTLPAEIEARFLQEAWVTGGLEHPGIVPVYELGRTPSGVPYYTMRLVRGERTLEDAITEAETAEERLALVEPFLKVCDAVRYAHSRSVIHRDLKPANIALGPFGEVVLLDWGLAKMHNRPDVTGSVWQARLDEMRLESDLDTMTSSLGTPGYMAPEAARGELSKVGKRSDVYGLGAILYRILTGRLPFKFETYAEFVGNVEKGVHEVPGAPAGLAHICLKAMALQREDRYERVDQLANDIRSWQTETSVDREVHALMQEAEVALQAAAVMEGDALLRQVDRTIAVVSRVRQLRPDHPGAAALLEKARERRAQAITEREQAARRRLLKRVGVIGLATATAATVVVAVMLNARRQEAEDARSKEATARARAVQERTRAEELARFMLIDLRDGLKPIGRLDLLGKVARESLDYYETLPTANVSDATWLARGVALDNVGAVLQATGDLQSAETSFRAALEIFERLGAERQITRALAKIGDVEDASGALKAARASFSRALAIAKRVAEKGDDTDWQQVSLCLHNIGDIEGAEGNTQAAMARYRESLTIMKRLAAKDPSSAVWQREVSVNLDKIGKVQTRTGDLKSALATLRESLAIAQRLAQRDPENRGWQRDLYVSLWKVGNAEKAMGDLKTAAPRFHAALAIARSLVDRDPTNTVWQWDLSGSLEMVGDVQRESGDIEDAGRSYRESLDIARRLVARDATNREWQRHLSAVLARVGNIELNKRNLEGAIEAHREALRIAKSLASVDESNIASQQDLATSYVRIGGIEAAMREREKALLSYRSALEIARRVAAHDPENTQWQRELSLALYRVGTTLQALGSLEAEPVLKEAVDAHAAAVKRAPHLEREHGYWTKAYHAAALVAGKRSPQTAEDQWALGYGLYRRKEFDRAVVHMTKALEDPKRHTTMGNLYTAACAAALVTGPDAERWHKQAIAWLAADLRLNGEEIERIDAELAKPTQDKRQREQLTLRVGSLRHHIGWAREGDPDLASLRTRADFKALFTD